MDKASLFESTPGDGGVVVEWRLAPCGTKLVSTSKDSTCKVRGASWSVAGVLARVFLPAGYPHSVRSEYLEYQFFDSLQGLSSYLRGVLCTRSILVGAGVGDASVTPLAVASSWILKDGVAIAGSLVFAYHFSDAFECNLKEWRLAADVLNNVGLSLDLLTGLIPTRHFLLVSGLSSLAKALCGLVAGATKARISQHFARGGHLADVISKESTQETAVCLLGLGLGMALSHVVGDDDASTWAIFVLLLLLHQWANWCLVKVLVLDTLSGQRLLLMVQDLMREGQGGAVPSPQHVGARERLWRPLLLWWRGPRFGASVQHLALCPAAGIDWVRLQECWGADVSTVCLPGLDARGRVLVILRAGGSELDAVRAHLIGYFLFLELDAIPWGSLASRYRALAETAAPRARAWAARVALVSDAALRASFEGAGWDVGVGQARLGQGSHRVSLATKSD